jgi:hypothetical protein
MSSNAERQYVLDICREVGVDANDYLRARSLPTTVLERCSYIMGGLWVFPQMCGPHEM